MDGDLCHPRQQLPSGKNLDYNMFAESYSTSARSSAASEVTWTRRARLRQQPEKVQTARRPHGAFGHQNAGKFVSEAYHVFQRYAEAWISAQDIPKGL